MNKHHTIQMLTIDQAADHVSVSTRTVRRWIKDKDLIAHRFGRRWRIAHADLIAFLNRHRNPEQ